MISFGPPTVGGLEQAQVFSVGVVTILSETRDRSFRHFKVVNI